MEHLISSTWHGLLLVFMWPNIVYPIAGTLAAMLFAFMPGLSGVTLMALAIPLTLHWDPLPVMLLFGARSPPSCSTFLEPARAPPR
jgi:TctA family transporter